MNLPRIQLEPESPRSEIKARARPAAAPRDPAFLANADYYGTLAATRALGQRGVPIYVGSERLLAVSRWSRHATRVMPCPPFAETSRFLDWLGALGAREPGVVLYPTSDEAAFLYSLHKDQLSLNFQMYQPEVEALVEVLDKKRLYAQARAVGLDVPETWFPQSESDVARIAREAPMPVLIKPRTQILSRTHSKGVVVERREELVPLYRKFVAQSQFGAALLGRIPDAAQAMIQAYVPAASTQIYVLAAFLDRSGTFFAARGAMKIFQRPRTLGIGLCFEDAPVVPEIAGRVRELARRTGYFGVFQIEFIRTDDRLFLIDYNPRFYNQLAFEMARGLPLAELAYVAARGEVEEVARLVGEAARPHEGGYVFCNEFGLEFLLLTQRLAGRTSSDDMDRWRSWRDHRAKLVNPVDPRSDRIPALIDIATQLAECARHPRAFLRNIVLDRAAG